MLQAAIVPNPDRDSGEWETPERFTLAVDSVQIVKLFRLLGSGASSRTSLLGQFDVELWAWRITVDNASSYYLELQQNYTVSIAHLSLYTSSASVADPKKLSVVWDQLVQLMNRPESAEELFRKKYQSLPVAPNDSEHLFATIQLETANQMNVLLGVIGAAYTTHRKIAWRLQHVATKKVLVLVASPNNKKRHHQLMFGGESPQLLQVFVSDVALLLGVPATSIKTSGLIERESSSTEERSELIRALESSAEPDAARKAILIHQGKTCFVAEDSYQKLFLALFSKPLSAVAQSAAEPYYNLHGVCMRAPEWVSLLSSLSLPPHEYIPRSAWFTFKKPTNQQGVGEGTTLSLPVYHSLCRIFEGEKRLALCVMLSLCLAKRNFDAVLTQAEGKWYPVGRHAAIAQRAWACVYYYPPGLYEQLSNQTKQECLAFWGGKEPDQLPEQLTRSMWQAEMYTLMSMSSMSV